MKIVLWILLVVFGFTTLVSLHVATSWRQEAEYTETQLAVVKAQRDRLLLLTARAVTAAEEWRNACEDRR